MPITRTDLGTYYCAGEYGSRDSINDKLSKFTTKFPVNESFVASQGQGSQPSIMDNFEASVINVHKIKVTWRPPSSQGVIWSEESQFIEASVSRTIVDKDGREMIAPQSLFTTSGSGSFVYDSGVVLSKFQRATPVINNYSITLYVESQLCHPHCRYSCNVPYKDCVGKDAQFCVCSRQDSVDLITESSSLSLNYFYTQQTSTPSFLHTDSSFTPTLSCEDSSLWMTLFIVSTCLLAICVIAIIVLVQFPCKYCKSGCLREICIKTDMERKENGEADRSSQPPQEHNPKVPENVPLLRLQMQNEAQVTVCKQSTPDTEVDDRGGARPKEVYSKDAPHPKDNTPKSTQDNKVNDRRGTRPKEVYSKDAPHPKDNTPKSTQGNKIDDRGGAKPTEEGECESRRQISLISDATFEELEAASHVDDGLAADDNVSDDESYQTRSLNRQSESENDHGQNPSAEDHASSVSNSPLIQSAGTEIKSTEPHLLTSTRGNLLAQDNEENGND